MNKTLAISVIALVAVVMIVGSFAPALAAPSSGEKDNACAKEKNPKSNAAAAAGCNDSDGDGKADRYDSAPDDSCVPDAQSEACNVDSLCSAIDAAGSGQDYKILVGAGGDNNKIELSEFLFGEDLFNIINTNTGDNPTEGLGGVELQTWSDANCQ